MPAHGALFRRARRGVGSGALWMPDSSQVLHQWVPIAFVSEYVHLSYLLYTPLIALIGLPIYFAKGRRDFRLFTTTLVATFAPATSHSSSSRCRVPSTTSDLLISSKHSYIAHWWIVVAQGFGARGRRSHPPHIAVSIVTWPCAALVPKLSPSR